MKVEQKRIDGEGAGFIKLLPEVEDDMWHVYNLLVVGDRITAVCFRKVTHESNTGSVEASRVRIKLKLAVSSVDFDKASCQIRVKGKNLTENNFIKIGQFHTLELELNRPFSIEKVCWDDLYLQRVADACDMAKTADVAAMVMQPGLAHLCLITSHMTQVRAKVDINIPRKRLASSSGHDKAMLRFFEAMGEAIVKHIDFNIVKCLIIASPGFLKEDFLKWLMVEASKRDWTKLLEHKAKLLPCHSSSGFKHSLKEVLADSTVAAKINNTKAFGEVKALEQFFDALQHDPDKAYYGFAHVKKATEQKAVDTLLLADSLFRSDDAKVRQAYVDLCAAVKEHGGDVRVFSSLHVSGEQLMQISGVAALLRFPLPDIDDDDAEDATTTTVAAAVPIAAPVRTGPNDFKRTDAGRRDAAQQQRDAKTGGAAAPAAAAAGAGAGVASGRGVNVSAASKAEALKSKAAQMARRGDGKTAAPSKADADGDGDGGDSDDADGDGDEHGEGEVSDDEAAEVARRTAARKAAADEGDTPDDNPADGDYEFDADADAAAAAAAKAPGKSGATAAAAKPAAAAAAGASAKPPAAAAAAGQRK